MPVPAASRRTKSGKVYDEVRALALRLGPDARLPTMTQLRDTLGASIATLDSVLSDLEERNIIRRRHGVGIYVASHVKRPIALLVNLGEFSHSNASPFWNILLEQVRERAAQWSDSVHFYATFDDQDSDTALGGSLLENIERGRIQGILGVGIPTTVSRQLIAMDVPHAVYAAYGGLMVAHDSDALIVRGTAALAAQGCRAIHLWQPVTKNYQAEETEGGSAQTQALFRRELDRNGLAESPAIVQRDSEQIARREAGRPAESPQAQGLRLAQQTFGDVETPPDGLLILDDMMTFGALAHLRKMRLEVGRDIKIATHANAGSSILMGYEDALIRLEFDPAELVETLFALLEGWMRGEKSAEDAHYLPPRLRLSDGC